MESGNWVRVRQLTMEEVKRSSQVRINHIEKKKLFSSQDLQGESVLVEGESEAKHHRD